MTKSNRRATESSADSDSPPGPLSGLDFAVIGAGRVGASFGTWAVAAGARWTRISGRSAERLARRRTAEPALDGALGDARWDDAATFSSADCDVLLLTVADPDLGSVAEALAARPQAPVALHASGHFDAEALAPLRAAGCSVGSLHPLKAFADIAPEPPAGLLFGIDGDDAAREMAAAWALAFGGRPHEVSGQRRVLYHLAASLAAGGVATVLALVERLVHDTDLPPPLLGSYLDLARGAIDALGDAHGDEEPLVDAVTGPAARGDLPTLERQRRALLEVAPDLEPMVEGLMATTRSLCAPDRRP
ncbi:MAG: DUF2520 domain-containing protein [Acidobacteriota bacterium]